MRGMWLGLMAGAALIGAAPASATVVTYNWVAGDYTGTVSYNNAATPYQIYTENAATDSGINYYSGNDFKVSVTYQGSTTTFSQQLNVENNYYGNYDGYEFYNGQSPLGYFDLQFQDATGHALSSRTLPSTIDPSIFPTKRVFVGNGSNPIAITSFSLAGAVPEPASWAMMLTGFLGIGMAMRRRPTRTAARG